MSILWSWSTINVETHFPNEKRRSGFIRVNVFKWKCVYHVSEVGALKRRMYCILERFGSIEVNSLMVAKNITQYHVYNWGDKITVKVIQHAAFDHKMKINQLRSHDLYVQNQSKRKSHIKSLYYPLTVRVSLAFQSSFQFTPWPYII